MANIDTYLQAIMDAVYGEQVRGSIHDAIALINDVSEAVLTIGTAVTSPTSSSTGFFEDSLYVNSITWDLWKCTGTDTWSLEGNIKGETGNGIVSVVKTSTSDLVDTYTILFTDGTHTTFDVTNGKSIVSIAKTSTSGLVDTYTITFNDTTTTTFTVTNGIDGNRWFRGTDISGKAVNPTVYVNSGITDARPNDYYLNPSEGAVYYCVTGGDAATATWSYELTMSGGGGGGNLADLGDVDLTGLDDGMILMYDATSTKWEAKAIVFSDLTDVVINSPADGELMTYDSTAGKWKNKKPDKSFVRYAGAINFADLVTYANTYLTEEYEDAFFLMRTSGTIGTGEASSYWSSNFHDGDEIPADSHIAVININRGTLNPAVYKYDDFGGFVDLSTVDEKRMITENDAFNPNKTYTAGEWLIHQGVLYKVITACTGITPPNATYYEPQTIEEALDALNSDIVALNTHQSLTISAGSVNFSIISKSGYRVGNHIHAEVYGTLNATTSEGNTFPYFTIAGIKKPTANMYVGTIIILDNTAHPTIACAALATLQPNGYFTQKAKASVTTGERFSFIVDYYED